MTNDLITKIKNSIIKEALEHNIITPAELDKWLGKYADDLGYDEFVNYLHTILDGHTTFYTLNRALLANKKELEERFKVKIFSPDQVWEGMMDSLAGAI